MMADAVIETVDEKTLSGMNANITEKYKVHSPQKDARTSTETARTCHVHCGECQELVGGSVFL